jgi:hypothetical protein
MPAHKKKITTKKCRRCGELFQDPFQTVCDKCRRTLPKCGSCHIVIAPEYGYLESFARKVGKYKICTRCDYELRRKGFLHLSESQYLYPSGHVRIRNVPAEDKV